MLLTKEERNAKVAELYSKVPSSLLAEQLGVTRSHLRTLAQKMGVAGSYRQPRGAGRVKPAPSNAEPGQKPSRPIQPGPAWAPMRFATPIKVGKSDRAPRRNDLCDSDVRPAFRRETGLKWRAEHFKRWRAEQIGV